jgi:hypothetical protein
MVHEANTEEYKQLKRLQIIGSPNRKNMEQIRINRVEQIKKNWKQFKWIFWTLFVIKLISVGGLEAAIENQSQSVGPAMIYYVMQWIAIIGMVIAMGYYSYKISGKKLYVLTGFFGLVWLATLGIFAGFFIVMLNRDKQLKIT